MYPDRVSTEPRCYQFGAYVADARKRLLWRGHTLTPLTSKAFEILLVLVENRGRVVGKSELLELVWQQTAVEDNTLTRHISTLRKALEERPEDHQYILTVPGRGYQFVGDVVELEEWHGEPHVERTAPSPHVESIQGVTSSGTSGEPAAVPVRRLRAAVVFGVVLLAIIAGTLVLATFRLRPSTVATLERNLRQFTFQSGLQRSPTWSPDGRGIAFVSDRAGNSDLWVQKLNEPQATQVTTSTVNESEPDWSPDGQSLVFRSEANGGGLFVVAVTGGAVRQITGFGYKPRWSPDGTLVLFSSSGHQGGTPRFHLVNANGGEPRVLPADILAGITPLNVAWRPDGRVSVWGRDAKERWTLATSPIGGGPALKSSLSPEVERRFLSSGVVFDRFVWDRSGTRLFFEGSARETRSLWRVTVDPKTLAWIGGPERLTSGTTADEDLAVSPDATRVAFAARSSRTRLWAFPFDPIAGTITGAGQPVTSGGGGEQDADTPDDGSKLVYRAMRGGRQEVWERTVADGRERLLVSSGEWFLSRPRWSADGTHLAYLRRRAGARGPSLDAAVAVFAVDRGQERLLTRPGKDALVPSDWSTDGRTLLGGCPQGPWRRVGTCLLDVLDSDQPTAPLRVLAADPARNFYEQRFSPDQRWISFISVSATDAGVSTVCIMPAAGGPCRAVTDGREYDDKPHWAPDGRTLYFVSHREGALNVWGRRFDAAQGTPVGAPFQVTSFSGPRQMISTSLAHMQIALTDDRLFLPITETQSELWILDNVDR